MTDGGWEPFARVDGTPDDRFYAQPRLVQHIGDWAIAALRARYGEVLAGVRGPVLDLMSSWVSHLPDPPPATVGLGMNAVELAANPQLRGWLVHDLNRQPALPFATAGLGATICAVSVQYLTRPVEVWSEVARVTASGGPVVVAFSNRCFPTKAIAAWMAMDDRSHCQLVASYLDAAGLVDIQIEAMATSDDPIFIVRGASP